MFFRFKCFICDLVVISENNFPVAKITRPVN